MIHYYYYYYYQKLYCLKNIGNFPENYHRTFSEIFWKNMTFSGKIFPPHTTHTHTHTHMYERVSWAIPGFSVHQFTSSHWKPNYVARIAAVAYDFRWHWHVTLSHIIITQRQ